MRDLLGVDVRFSLSVRNLQQDVTNCRLLSLNTGKPFNASSRIKAEQGYIRKPMKLMLNCKDVHDHASDYLDKRLSKRKRLAIWMHVMMCSHCRRFMQQLRLTVGALQNIRRTQETDTDTEKLGDELYQRFMQHQKDKG